MDGSLCLLAIGLEFNRGLGIGILMGKELQHKAMSPLEGERWVHKGPPFRLTFEHGG